MASKEKAIELRDKFRDENYYSEEEILSAAKNTALQVVEELILENHRLDSYEVKSTAILVDRLNYWEAVKIELESL